MGVKKQEIRYEETDRSVARTVPTNSTCGLCEYKEVKS